ncbi:MAG: metallophosphoesterase family protein [Anaerolineae bacterium]|jgi:predicted phosphodiesterase|nr:metallophosphoesterase family protein [Anaerolineae bacterium]
MIEVAVISDVHGNRWALEAVLADITRRGIRRMMNLGDCLYGPLDPAGTAELLLGLSAVTVKGNQDRVILAPAQSEDSPTLQYVRASLASHHVQWLASLPMTLVVDDLFYLCHGTPECDDVYLLREVREREVVLRNALALETLLRSITQPVVLCGHDHSPEALLLPRGQLLVNPGSVGLPAYTDDLPFPHAMETGMPHARYAIVSRQAGKWAVQDVAVAYDWEAAARAAEENGRPDWAAWLRTGRA